MKTQVAAKDKASAQKGAAGGANSGASSGGAAQHVPTIEELDSLELEIRRQLEATERNLYNSEGKYIKETTNFGKLATSIAQGIELVSLD